MARTTTITPGWDRTAQAHWDSLDAYGKADLVEAYTRNVVQHTGTGGNTASHMQACAKALRDEASRARRSTMNLQDLLVRLICETFDRNFKFATPHDPTKAMHVGFRLDTDYDALPKSKHDRYYPKAELLLWAPGNYVKVFVREVEAHDEVKGPWVKVHDHDSCWRDGVRDFIAVYGGGASGTDAIMNWYDTITVTEEPTQDLRGAANIHRDELRMDFGRIQAAAVLKAVYRGAAR